MGKKEPELGERRSPSRFFLLVMLLSVPFWVLGAITNRQLLPGLPVSAFMVFCPLLAASILVFREAKTRGLTDLLKRSFDFKRTKSKVWIIPAVFLMPGLGALTYGWMRLMHRSLPNPQFPGSAIVFALPLALIAALGEELGWSGYVIEPMQGRWNALRAGVLLGFVWAAWHVIPFVQAGRSFDWIAWQGVNMIATRVLLVWLYNNSGRSVFAVALCHATSNISWQLFPNRGSHYDPRLSAIVTLFAACLITIVWGPRSLARSKRSR